MLSLVPIASTAIRSLWFTIAGLLTAIIVGLVTLHAHGYRLLSVQTASMLPTIRPKDALVIKPIPLNQLRVGAIISYRSPHNQAVVITHRLIAISPKTAQLTTKGDALHSSDPPFPAYLVVGQATAIAPQFGRVLDLLHRPIGLALAVYGPAILIVMTEAGRLTRVYARPLYNARL